MNDLPLTAPRPPAPGPGSNLPEYTVSELSLALKRSIEDDFAHVRVRGEVSGFKRHGSGHCYFALKDADAVLDAVCWRMTAVRLGLKPEDGMEVVCSGRLTTFPAARNTSSSSIRSSSPVWAHCSNCWRSGASGSRPRGCSRPNAKRNCRFCRR